MNDSPINPEFEEEKPQLSSDIPKRGKALSKISREISEQDLNNNPAAQRLILDKLDTAESKVYDLEIYVEKYHQADKERNVLAEKLKNSNSYETLYTVGIGVGCALITVFPTFDTLKSILGFIFGATLLVIAIISKIIKK